MSPHGFLRILSKILPFNSARNPNSVSALLIGYTVAISAGYLAAFGMHFSGPVETLQSVNKAVLRILIACYLIAFFSVIISNYLNSRRYEQCLSKLEVLDKNLSNFGQPLRYKRTNCVITATIASGATIFAYFIVCDLMDLFLNYVNVNYSYLLFVYVSFFMCFSSSIFIALHMFILHQRYGMIYALFTQKTPQSDTSKPPPTRKLVDLLMGLTEIANDLVRCFAPQVASIFLIAFVVITHDLYLLIKGNFNITTYLNLINLISIHFIELVLIVISYHFTKLKEEEIVKISPRLLSICCLTDGGYKNNLECYSLIHHVRFDTTIFGMFQPSPSMLLTITVSIISYLVVLIQFTGTGRTFYNLNSLNARTRQQKDE